MRTRLTATVRTKILSVAGSSAVPVGVTCENRRAYQPSSTSHAPAARSTASAAAGCPSVNGKTAASGSLARLSIPGTRQRSRARKEPIVCPRS